MPQALVATLVAGSGAGLSPSLVQAFVDRLESAGAEDICRVWLEPEKAIDIFYQGADEAADYPPMAQQILADHRADCIIQPAAGRQKKLLIADMESTIIEQEMLDELAETIGLRDKVAAITARAMNGELDFAAALRERVGLLRGLPASVLDDVARRITLMSGADALLAAMKSKGASAWLVSGGFTCFAKPVAERLGFDRVFANELIIRDGKIAGEVTQPVLDKNSKKHLLGQAAKELGLSLQQTIAVGDGANDIPMLSACVEGGGLGFAFHAKPNVRAVIPHQINHSDLRTILYAQGYGN